jgi:hypothetical protein
VSNEIRTDHADGDANVEEDLRPLTRADEHVPVREAAMLTSVAKTDVKENYRSTGSGAHERVTSQTSM